MIAQGSQMVTRARPGKDGTNGTDGNDGKDGKDGLSHRYSKWVEGVEYRNDNNPYYRDSNGQGIIDVVFKDAISIYDPSTDSTPPKGYICRKTHISGSTVEFSSEGDWTQSGNTFTSNKGVQSTWAKIKFLTYAANTVITVKITASSEANYDWGYVCGLDKAYSTSDYLAKVSGTNTQTVEITVPTRGEHYFYAGYAKDSSGDANNDNVVVEILSVSPTPIPLAVGEYWAQTNARMPILSALVIADRIKANFIDVENLAANSAFIDSLVVNKLVAGIQNGQRVEITPDRKSVNIYDADGSLASTFEGNRYTDISALFGTSSGGVELSVRTVSSWGQAAGVSMGKGSSPTLSGATLGDPMKSYSGKANLCAPFYTSTPTEITLGAGKVTLAARSGVQPSGDKTGPVALSGATVGVNLTVATYSDEACTTQIDYATLAFAALMVSYEQDGTDERTSTVDWAGSKIQTCAGWHRITIECYLSIQNPGSTADMTWGYPTELSGVTYNSDFYVSRYFANGLCLGARGNNYISLYNQASGGMRMKMENGGYGFDFSGGGIMFRRSESEGWKSLIPAYGLPLGVLAMGKMNLDSTSPSMGSYRTVEGINKGMGVSLQSKGNFKVTVPSSWGSSYLVQLTTLGRTDSGNPIGASVSSISSGSFIVDTMSLKGNWVNEAKVMFLITRLEDFNT